MFRLNQLQKILMGKVADWVKKNENDLLNYKYKVTFQPDGCVEPTCTSCVLFIWLLKCTFVVFYLFVYLLFLLVS